MRPADIQQIGTELAIRWDNGTESFIPIAKLRAQCPCAGCQGETDVMGHVHKFPSQALSPAAYQLRTIQRVGGYAIQPVWADGHATGLYSFEYLQRLAQPE
jgi:DUF971 family protein